jgi:hypothetical protein
MGAELELELSNLIFFSTGSTVFTHIRQKTTSNKMEHSKKNAMDATS